MTIETGPHRRYDPLRGSWVLVAAGRSSRPWRGQIEAARTDAPPAHDPSCQLCPRNERASGIVNPDYNGAFVFVNDFPALRPETPPGSVDDGLHRAEAQPGTARVVCFSPWHDRSLGSLEASQVRVVVDVWADQTAELGEQFSWVQVFENRGEAMGASNPHPHGQVWAGTAVPSEAAREDESQRQYRESTARVLLDDVVAQEVDGPLVVEAGPHWLAIVPYWATWPFEALLVARDPVARLPELGDAARDELATLLGNLLRRYDALFDRPFPYSMGWHQAPFRPAGDEPRTSDHWRLHAHVYPPLLRADARKFMVGYELLAEPQRDLSPEEAAARLRDAGH